VSSENPVEVINFYWSNTMKTIMQLARKYDDISETLISSLFTIVCGIAILGIAPAVIILAAN
tara:strand:- start:6526 stop:6711 length:186 start_codon:yes stop_codon:yes gene_type:complete